MINIIFNWGMLELKANNFHLGHNIPSENMNMWKVTVSCSKFR
jgi:hypothetical protein